MVAASTWSFVLYAVLAFMGLAAFIVSIVTFTAPSEYNPYEWGFREEDAHENDHLEPGFDPAKNARKRRAQSSVVIVVLGDIGRSPRMQYHAISFAKHGARVCIVGFKESDLHPELQSNHLVNIMPLKPPPLFLQKGSILLFTLFGPLKVIWQTVNLYHTLGYKVEPTQWMLVQNPPSIPTLAVANIICFFRNTRLVIDWHNFGWSVLALKLGKSHPLVRLAWLYEWIWAHGADAHLAVTNAMAEQLHQSVRVEASTLHDRPAAGFQPMGNDRREKFLHDLEETSPYASDLARGKWRLIVSSTSWTADEDFSLLLDGLVKYSEFVSKDKSLPKILAIITGKGPQKESYLKEIEQLKQSNRLPNVLVRTAWLSTADYASLLASSDLGISLHKSASGVDLPMKVVDMFGAGLPVIGWGEFESWPELVKEGINGKSFDSSEKLCSLIIELFSDDSTRLLKLKEGALKECAYRWDDEWDKIAGKRCFALPNLHART